MNAVRQRGNGNSQGYRILRNKQKRWKIVFHCSDDTNTVLKMICSWKTSD